MPKKIKHTNRSGKDWFSFNFSPKRQLDAFHIKREYGRELPEYEDGNGKEDETVHLSNNLKM